jgi:malate dehydrogenase (oxaloacetate-decarboxylating)
MLVDRKRIDKGDSINMNYNEMALKMHEEHKGKISVTSKVAVKTRDDLSTAYTPGVAEPCRKIRDNKDEVYRYTAKGNLVAVVSDGTAVLGLGDIGPEAAMPVMEGKSILFKEFAGIDAFPICLDTKDTDEIVETVKRLAPTFGGINLEDISAPRCFEIERRLKEELDIPVFHDDQHGTAIVVSAGLTNALKYVGKEFSEAKVVINGAGSAGISICKLLLELGVGDIVLVDRNGILAVGEEWMNPAQKVMAEKTNKEQIHGDLKTAMQGRDVFVGVSAPNIVTAEMVSTMAKDAVVFAMANPTPEIMPDEAKKGGARVVATGRSDFPNQINNVLVFPGIFKGALEARATDITEEMKIAAVRAIADIIKPEELTEDYIIPGAFDERVADNVAREVAKTAIETGVSKLKKAE